MKKFTVLTLAVALVALVAVTSAFAHTSAMSVTAACNTTTGLYDVTWTVGPTTDLTKAPKVFASNRTSIPVGSALGASTDFKESVAGTSTNVSAAITVKWSDNVTGTPTASLALAGSCKKDVPCPEGFKDGGVTNGVRLCTKETTTTVTVPGPTVTVPGPTVFGHPNCTPPAKEIARADGSVTCQVTVTKIKIVPKVKIRKVLYCPKTAPGPKPKPSGPATLPPPFTG